MQWFIFSLTVVLLALLGSRKTKYDVCFRIAMAAVMAYVIGFGGVGTTDHEGYALLFNNAASDRFGDIRLTFGRVSDGLEWGYWALCWIAGRLGLGEAGFFCMVAFIANILVLEVLHRYSKHFVFACLLFILSEFFMQEPNLVRQTLSASIIMFALKYIDDDKPKVYVIFVLLASLMHTSGLVFLLLLLLRRVNFEKNRVVLLIVLMILWVISLMFLYGLLHSNFLDVVNIFIRMRGGDVLSNLGGSEKFTRSVSNDIMNLLVFVVFIYFLFVNKKAKLNVRIFLFFLGPIFFNMGENSYSLFRFAYFFPLLYAIVPNILYDFKLGKKENEHLLYYVYVLWNVSILIRTHILNDHPRFFDEMYSLKDFFA